MKLTIGFSLIMYLAHVFTAFLSPEKEIVPVECDTETYCNECITKLPPYNFVKSFRIEKPEAGKDKLEHSYVFTKGTTYMINICSSSPNDVINGILVNLYDSKRNLVAVNYVADKVVNTVAYECPATGIYYIQYKFGKAAANCAGSALGFHKVLN